VSLFPAQLATCYLLDWFRSWNCVHLEALPTFRLSVANVIEGEGCKPILGEAFTDSCTQFDC
jgi:hypothetical protein